MKTYTKTITTGEQSNVIQIEIDGGAHVRIGGCTTPAYSAAELKSVVENKEREIREKQLKRELLRVELEAAAVALGFALCATAKG